jgi:uncharacterized membrane protein YccC
MKRTSKPAAFLAGHPVVVYILEFWAASAAAYGLLLLYPRHRLVWAMTSIALVLSVKSSESKKLIYDRIKANVLGAVVGGLLMLVPLPDSVLFCAGVCCTVFCCKYLGIYPVVRTALVALVIVMIPAYEEGRMIVAVERVSCVAIGCLIALAVTWLFDFLLGKIAAPEEKPAAGGA